MNNELALIVGYLVIVLFLVSLVFSVIRFLWITFYRAHRKLWITGRTLEGGRWRLLGVYNTESRALSRCNQPTDFVGPATLNEDLPEDRAVWLGSYRYCPGSFHDVQTKYKSVLPWSYFGSPTNSNESNEH